MGGTVTKVRTSVVQVQENMGTTLTTATNMINRLQRDASNIMANLAHESLESLRGLTTRMDRSVFLLTNTVMAIATAIALSFLLLLTSFSPFLRNIVWLMFATLCIYMILTYIQHSQSAPPLSSTTQVEEKPKGYQNALLESIIAQSNIQSAIDLTGHQLIDDDIKIVVTQAIIKKKCTQLKLGQNRITSTGASYLADALRQNNTLEVLSLWNNNLNDIGIRYLTDMLKINKSLKKLDLSGNHITNIGAMHLTNMLKINRILTHLSLSRTKIDDKGIQPLANDIQNNNKTLQVLSLSGNKLLTDLSVNALSNMIKGNQSLTKLWIDDCELSKKNQAELRKAEKSKKNFKLYM
ncbi:unnamed protein product [Adineta steineri]|uniref:Uncharacterized protein n=1 Tax=Adineta steineri TaxID=433720 RepID=A0A818Y5G3_9BILA|nr:unnamed protein product [Adineta steineri]CAF3747838.1 unnamed protein product [Adineta steineri]